MKHESKYHARKTVVDGVEFDSRKEAKRWQELRLLEKAGAISNLKRQVRFELIPAQRDKKTGKVIERACSYIADFCYTERNGAWEDYVVEDAKGYRTDAYKIKRKLMLQEYGVRIRET